MNEYRVITYKPAYRDDFVRLNKAWIERYFRLEPADLELLEDPEGQIMDRGGEIFFALDGHDEAVGCCALVPYPTRDCYELVKMTVDERMRGHGVGRLLGEAFMDYARRHGVKRIYLEGNTTLKASLALYRRLGFHEVPMTSAASLERIDILMEVEL